MNAQTAMDVVKAARRFAAITCAVLLIFTNTQQLAAAEQNPLLSLIPHKAEYRAHIKKGISLSGTAVRELRREQDGSWLYRFDVSTLPANISESTALKVAHNALQPQKYEYSLKGFLIKDRKQNATFDWTAEQLSEHYKKKSWTLPTSPNLQDRLSYQLQLQLDISSGREQFSYKVIHKGKIRQYDFNKRSEESIETSIGTKDAIVIVKARAPDKKRQTTLWFDKTHPNILLRMIQIEEDGETYEINITNLTL